MGQGPEGGLRHAAGERDSWDHAVHATSVEKGWGCCIFFNGDFYEGQWAKGLREGCGMQQVRVLARQLETFYAL